MSKEKCYPLLLQWQRNWEIDDKMLWKKSAEKQTCFVRDNLCRGLLHTPVFVVSTHTSKSIRLPVYRFRMHNGILVTARENFYGWVVSIKSPFPVNLPDDLVHGDGANNNEDISSCYCEGFKEDWVYPYGIENVRLSTFRVEGDYRLYALMCELNKYPALREDENFCCGEYVTKITIKQMVERYKENLSLSDIFCHSYYSGAYSLDFCRENNLDSFFHASSRELTEEQELEEQINDFAKRICMSPENSKMFNAEMEGLWIGRIEETEV